MEDMKVKVDVEDPTKIDIAKGIGAIGGVSILTGLCYMGGQMLAVAIRDKIKERRERRAERRRARREKKNLEAEKERLKGLFEASGAETKLEIISSKLKSEKLEE